MNISIEKSSYIDCMMKRFKLVDIRNSYLDIIEEAEKASMSYLDFLIRLLEVENEGKDNRRTNKLMNLAHFDSIKTLEEIDYSFNPAMDKDRIDDLGKLHFMTAAENIVIIGPPGVGKTMVATGIGINACKRGYRVMFVNAKELIDRLYDEMTAGTLPILLEGLAKIDLLIVDELSYVKMDKERESLFFQIIRQRYEKSSLIITTNLPVGRWNEIFTGKLAATAILDRVLHHCHLLSISGESYRVKGPKTIQIQGENQR